MKRLMKKVGFALLFFSAFSVANAQTSPHDSFVFMQQSQIDTVYTASTTPAQYRQNMGSGYVGTSTLAFLTFTYQKVASYSYGVGDVTLQGYTDSTYTTTKGGACEWNNQGSPGDPSVTSGFVQLNPINGSFTGCSLDPTAFYQVTVTFQYNPASVTNLVYYGTVTATGFMPQFALTGGGFFITPTASTTGLFLSGAQEFCNSQFGTSTNGVLGIGTDIANGLCQVFGYMFVPTPNSLQAFSDLQPTLAEKAPFSFVYGTMATWNGLVASTTANAPVDSLDYHSLGIGSTTPMGNILPSFTAFAASTTLQYFPAGTFTALKGLASVALILTLIADIFFTARNLVTV